jgi:predicted metal-dependent peptidase
MNPRALDAQKIAAARLWATARMPYLASAIFASTVVTQPDSDTIAIDRSWQVHADPEIVEKLTVDQLGRLFVHLSGHAIRDHAARAVLLGVAADNQRARWNRCADAEINDDLVADDVVPDVAPDLPRNLRCQPRQLAERYYKAARDGRRRWDCGSGADGCDRPGDGTGPIDPQQAQLLRLSTAAEIQREHGREPGLVPRGWLRWAESVLPSRIDWRRVLAVEVRSAVAAVSGKVDYSYRRPSRRAHLDRTVVLPTLRRPIPEVAIVCDTSGSMHDRLLARAITEIEAVLTKVGLRQTQVRVLAVDTDVHVVRRVSRAAHVQLAGGGGTDMGAGIESAAKLHPKPSVVIVLTDGYTPWPDQPPPGIRVIVGLLTERRRLPGWAPPGWAPPGWAPPGWAHTVVIEDADLVDHLAV